MSKFSLLDLHRKILILRSRKSREKGWWLCFPLLGIHLSVINGPIICWSYNLFHSTSIDLFTVRGNFCYYLFSRKKKIHFREVLVVECGSRHFSIVPFHCIVWITNWLGIFDETRFSGYTNYFVDFYLAFLIHLFRLRDLSLFYINSFDGYKFFRRGSGTSANPTFILVLELTAKLPCFNISLELQR